MEFYYLNKDRSLRWNTRLISTKIAIYLNIPEISNQDETARNNLKSSVLQYDRKYSRALNYLWYFILYLQNSTIFKIT